MFVYERDGNICVALEGNLPVNTPAYTIDIDEQAGTLSVNGQIIEPNTDVKTDTDVSNEPEQQPVEENTTVDKSEETQTEEPAETNSEEITSEE